MAQQPARRLVSCGVVAADLQDVDERDGTVVPRRGERLEQRQEAAGTCRGRLGWTLRDIEEAVDVRRETASRYLKAVGIAGRATNRRRPTPLERTGASTSSAAEGGSKPASPENGVSTDSVTEGETAPISTAIGVSYTDSAAEGGPNRPVRRTGIR
jgi:hypothetical protein